MRLILDFSRARIGRCHAYGGVTARIDGGRAIGVVIEANGARRGDLDGGGVPCGRPALDHVQAWSTAVLLTGREDLRPRDEGRWDEAARTMTYALGASRRRMLG